MKKSFNLKKSLALVLALGFSASCLVQVQALGGPHPGVHQTPVKQLKIKKVLNLPSVDVKTPAVKFSFTFTKHSYNGETDKTSECPDITVAKSVDYSEADTTDGDTNKQGLQLVKTTENVLNGVTFSKAGQYTYKVTEKQTLADNANLPQGLVMSKAEYLVSIFTKTIANNEVVVDNIYISQLKKDDGTDVEKKKVDYDSTSDTTNKFEFNNNYDPKAGNDNPSGKEINEDDKKGFVLQKNVEGEKANANEEFTFSLTVTKPEGSHGSDQNFNYKVVDSNGTAGNASQGAYGTAFTVNLKKGYRVVLSSVLLGSKVQAEETVSAGYTKTLAAGQCEFNGTAIATVDELKAGKKIGDKGDNSIIFVNTQQTPTGILLNSLPFIVLALVALAGIVFFVKNRKHDDLEA